MSAQTRWVVLDVPSPVITIDGDIAFTGASDNSAHLSTLWRSTSSGNSRVRFEFRGAEISFLGRRKNGTLGTQPIFNCMVDGEPALPGESATPEDLHCAWKGDDDGNTHTFILNITIPDGPEEPTDNNASVDLDSIWFLPSPEFSLNDPQALVEYDNNDPHIRYLSGNWAPLKADGGDASYATESGSSLSVFFTGTKITWEGWTPKGEGIKEGRSSGTYWINGSSPVSFNLDPPDPSDPATRRGVKLIEIENLPQGVHNLTVTYNGPSTPLVLDHFSVLGGNFRVEDLAGIPAPVSSTGSSPTLPSSSPRSSSPSTSLGSPSPSISGGSSPASSQQAPVGPIVGGVLGGLAVLLIAILAFIWVRRTRHKNDNQGTLRLTPNALLSDLPNSPRSTGTPISATPAPLSEWGATDRTDENGNYQGNENQAYSPVIYRKGQEPMTPPQHPAAESVRTMVEVHRHVDSGLREGRVTSLPPLYTPT